ncbi:hypothetical protein T02_2615 [Trichinella nativa]|uniref:Uncharacterized protein n=1 Tax=Trichinella nativa TaxID=6335 RepID=A0A0V1KJZ6_9BILA|nr:hypothetical protein T02_2615 [Trichinella nativa]
MGFQSSYSIPEFIDPIRHLSLYRPQRVDMDHFGHP